MGHGCWILYCTEKFGRLTKGTILKDKTAQSVVNGILDCWIYGNGMGPGPPSKHFFADHGLEFINSEVIPLCETNGIRLVNTSSYSPWSNGLNERNHSTESLSEKNPLTSPTSLCS